MHGSAMKSPSEFKLLATASEIKDLAEKIRSSDMISFDTEFIREQTFLPQLELIQIATDDEVWLVDAQAFLKQGKQQARKDLEPLLEIFRDPNILKVAHAIQGDQECIYTSLGITASPSLDTAIAASLCGYGESMGLANLLKSVVDVSIKKGHARTNWAVRPLPSQLLEYAAADVIHLNEAARRLLKELDRLGRRDWAMELSAAFEVPEQYEADPDAISARLGKGGKFDRKSFSVLRELVRWREERVRELNVPRKWLADDQVLMDLARVKPKDIEHLKAFRGLNKGEIRKSGEHLIQLIREARDSEAVLPPRSRRLEPASMAEAQVLDLLRCYIGILADEHRIAIRHLATSSQLLPLLRAQAKTPQEFIDKEILSPGAARLVGQEIIDFLSGKRVLSVEGTRVSVVEIQPSSIR